MKIYVVVKEDARRDETIPIKGFKKEEEAIKFLKLSVEEIIRDRPSLSVLDVSDKAKTIYCNDDDSYYYYEYKFYIRTVEVF